MTKNRQKIVICAECRTNMQELLDADEFCGVVKQMRDSGSCHCRCIFYVQELGANLQPPALSVACILNHIDCVKILTEAGADVNEMDDKNFTALSYAAQGGLSECMKILIESGADVNTDTCAKLSKLKYTHHNHECQRSALVCLVYPESFVQSQFQSNDYHLAMEGCRSLNPNSNRKECLQILLDAGAHVNIINKGGYTLLAHLAGQSDSSYYVKKLLEAGANVNLAGTSGESPIICALSNNAEKNLKLLLKAGADVNAKSSSVIPLLYYGNSNFTKLLLSAGLLLNMLDMSFIRGQLGDEFDVAGASSYHSQFAHYIKQNDLHGHLKHLCRVRIRNHLLELDPHQNLFVRVPQLGLPKSLALYLLYDVTVDDVSEDKNNDSEQQ